MLNTIISTATLYFFLISLVNVILSSIKSICTVRYGRGINVLTNVISYSFYTIVVKQTASLPLEVTVLSTAIANAIGVWVSYVLLDFIQKDKLWKIEVVVPSEYTEVLDSELKEVPHNYITAGPRTIFNFYCSTRADSAVVLKKCKNYEGKFFATENKYRGFER